VTVVIRRLLRHFVPRNDNGDSGYKEIASALRASQ